MTIINDMHETHLTTKIQNIENFLREVNIKQRALFHEICDEVFNSCPSLNTISWTQYTPYFNDGDPCEFGIKSEISFSTAPYKKVVVWQSDEHDKLEVEKNDVMELFQKFMCNNLELMKSTFGDGYFIRIHRNGEDVKFYDHE